MFINIIIIFINISSIWIDYCICVMDRNNEINGPAEHNYKPIYNLIVGGLEPISLILSGIRGIEKNHGLEYGYIRDNHMLISCYYGRLIEIIRLLKLALEDKSQIPHEIIDFEIIEKIKLNVEKINKLIKKNHSCLDYNYISETLNNYIKIFEENDVFKLGG